MYVLFVTVLRAHMSEDSVLKRARRRSLNFLP